MTVSILSGDCRDLLRTLPDESVHCIVTSPPYWGLRDYGVAGQIGLESTVDIWVNEMVEVFRECRRVLRDDGTLWLNLGDSYAGNRSAAWGPPSESSTLVGNGHLGGGPKLKSMTDSRRRDNAKCPRSDVRVAGLKPKDMVGQPWRVAFALQADGWWLRSEIIWFKLNPMPESVIDRPTRSHETIFLLSKSARYYFDGGAIAEPASPNTHARYAQNGGPVPTSGWADGDGPHDAVAHSRGRRKHGTDAEARNRGRIKATASFAAGTREMLETRNTRTVWPLVAEPFREAHFATFPTEIPRRCILAGCPEGGTVLDPFGGAGTTGLVADRLQRDAILIELNPVYAEMARCRIQGDAPLFVEVADAV
ncbi:MAG: site-specific DNA-methyltransferase [Steroidobacteraceae bacterium]|nr:site-specific DNA-methyltransferase [Steroidobacteraceae bacterium]